MRGPRVEWYNGIAMRGLAEGINVIARAKPEAIYFSVGGRSDCITSFAMTGLVIVIPAKAGIQYFKSKFPTETFGNNGLSLSPCGRGLGEGVNVIARAKPEAIYFSVGGRSDCITSFAITV